MEFVPKYESFNNTDGKRILDFDCVDSLRKSEMDNLNSKYIIAQSGGQENMLLSDVDILIGGGSRGGSKCLLTNELVCTPFGFRRIKDLKAGSIITGLDGCMQRVIYNSFNGIKDCYKVTFIDGSSVKCSYDHCWTLRQTNYISKKRHINKLDLSADWSVWSTEMIYDFLEKKKKGICKSNNLIIPLCEPVKFTRPFSEKPKINPYIIGALLGDGSFSESLNEKTVQFTSPDEFIIKEFAKYGLHESCFYQQKDNKAKDYRFNDKDLLDAVTVLKLWGKLAQDKFIPDCYKLGTLQDRWDIIQGLMDTDGTIDKRGHCSYTTVSKTLAEDVKFMINSLGGTATINKKIAGYKDAEGNFIRCKDAYIIYIKIRDSYRLFRLPRKKELSKKYNGGISEYGRRIVSCEKIGRHEVCCIRVTNPDSLYLTNDFIVTHNSFSLLLESLNDVKNKNFKAVIFRKEIDDLQNIVDESSRIFSEFGEYNKSKNDMTWNLLNGGSIKFNYYSDAYEDFKIRFQGKQFTYIGIDEITHIEYNKFKYLITCNRNAYGLRNRFWGTCNPDPDSWVAKFIDWWIDEEGYPIPERNGQVRYCFMDGDDVSTIYWGDTRDEVYEQCRSIIDKYMKPEYAEYGSPQDLFIKSVSFVEAKLSDNKKLMKSDPTYLANLANQGEEQRARDLDGNWKYKSLGDDLIKIPNMEAFFSNAFQYDDNHRRASCDVAFDGGDNLVLWLWVGNHIQDIFTCSSSSKMAMQSVKNKLEEWGVMEEDFTYDLSGIGQSFKGFFPRAVPFNNRESVDEKYKGQYDNIKSQCAYLFYQALNNLNISINPDLLSLKFSGRSYKDLSLRDILMNERKAIKKDINNTDKGFCIIKKLDMKKIVGHSPDFIEALVMKFIFNIKHKHKHITGLGWL